jgi:hypothetical protein
VQNFTPNIVQIDIVILEIISGDSWSITLRDATTAPMTNRRCAPACRVGF